MRIRHVFRLIIHFLLMVTLAIITLIRKNFEYYLLYETIYQAVKFLKFKAGETKKLSYRIIKFIKSSPTSICVFPAYTVVFNFFKLDLYFWMQYIVNIFAYRYFIWIS